jgi:type I restriction enzyme S subunit
MNLNIDRISGIRAVFPPSNEQTQIIAFLELQLVRYDELESKAITQIALLNERRTALISAAVTGKIDVRDWRPDQKSESEPIQAVA